MPAPFHKGAFWYKNDKFYAKASLVKGRGTTEQSSVVEGFHKS